MSLKGNKMGIGDYLGFASVCMLGAIVFVLTDICTLCSRGKKALCAIMNMMIVLAMVFSVLALYAAIGMVMKIVGICSTFSKNPRPQAV